MHSHNHPRLTASSPVTRVLSRRLVWIAPMALPCRQPSTPPPRRPPTPSERWGGGVTSPPYRREGRRKGAVVRLAHLLFRHKRVVCVIVQISFSSAGGSLFTQNHRNAAERERETGKRRATNATVRATRHLLPCPCTSAPARRTARIRAWCELRDARRRDSPRRGPTRTCSTLQRHKGREVQCKIEK
jgi:hypothetical protein